MVLTLLVIAGCAAPPPPASTPVARTAVPIPDEADFWSQPPTLDEVDTTVTLEELAAIGPWRKARRVDRGGQVMLALHVDQDGVLALSVVEDNTGIVQHFELGTASAALRNHTFDGNTYPGRHNVDGYSGPILFAIRALPHAGAEEHERRQIAVWADGTTLKVAERRPGADWTPLLRVAFPRRTSFVGIGTTYPH